jgi:hypothetical protein
MRNIYLLLTKMEVRRRVSSPEAAAPSPPSTSATINQIDSPYHEASGDRFVLAGILRSTQDMQPVQPAS